MSKKETPNKTLPRIAQWCSTLNKSESWCILVVADPDALGAAMGLKRILSHRVRDVTIASVNQVTRPDNLAMLRYLRIPLTSWDPSMQKDFDRFAIVDSQPTHNPAFKDIKFSVIIDHHPAPTDFRYDADFVDIASDMGSTCTMIMRYMNSLKIRPGKLLATALLYGIRTDTMAFDRGGITLDFQAYQQLLRLADINLMRRILRSEYLMQWLPLFSRAFRSLQTYHNGAHAHIGEVKSPDLLVAIADFFTRVHGLRWVAVSGTFEETLVIIFRGDGSKDMGTFAASHFGEVGSAGGHKNMARAEIPLKALEEIDELKPGEYVFNKLKSHKKK